MFGIGDIDSLGALLALPIRLLALAILARALLSWVRPDPYNPIVRALNAITDPILEPLRRIIPRIGMMDLTPMAAMFMLFILASLVENGLR